MKYLALLYLMFSPIWVFAQSEDNKDILLRTEQQDDTYLAGDSILVAATINGDLVVAGRQLVINDSIYGDLTAAGSELSINQFIADDARIAVGKIIVDSEIGDDLVVFAGEVLITENAIVNGNLKCIAKKIEINGKVVGNLDIKGSTVQINGEFYGNSKLIGDDITIESQAKFYKDVEYWSLDDNIDFEGALVNGEARYNQTLEEEKSEMSLLTMGMNSFSSWIFYIVSVLLVILLIHGLLRNAFSDAVVELENKYLKSFGFGLIYLIGIPLVIAIAFMIGIGLPLGLFMTGIFIFSLLVGHFISALVIVYFIKHKREIDWNFWSISLLALLITIILRLLTNIPYVGIFLSVIILSTTYGALTLRALRTKPYLLKK